MARAPMAQRRAFRELLRAIGACQHPLLHATLHADVLGGPHAFLPVTAGRPACRRLPPVGRVRLSQGPHPQGARAHPNMAPCAHPNMAPCAHPNMARADPDMARAHPNLGAW
eukprot:4286463-Prymnesium_polylepis.1